MTTDTTPHHHNMLPVALRLTLAALLDDENAAMQATQNMCPEWWVQLVFTMAHLQAATATEHYGDRDIAIAVMERELRHALDANDTA
jgi:hypothetical protein